VITSIIIIIHYRNNKFANKGNIGSFGDVLVDKVMIRNRFIFKRLVATLPTTKEECSRRMRLLIKQFLITSSRARGAP
jgi:hypothetical protein